jgi:hypothetical protein
MPDDAPLLDLSELDFRPAWAKEGPSAAPAFRAEDAAPRPERRPSRDFQRGRGPAGRDRRPGRGPNDRGPREHGPKRDRDRGPQRSERPAPPPNPFRWLRVAFTATEAAVTTVAQQVRHTGKTFSLFDIARILLRNPASYVLELTSVSKFPEGPFHLAVADKSVWLSREAAVRHLLRTRLGEFYRSETIEVEPPKGNFTVVAVCGMSGTLLGPPNRHDYEGRVRELHRERFGRMDFEHFRSRLRMERDPEVIEKWKSSAAQAVVYFPLGDGETERLDGLAAVEKHFLAHHAASAVQASATASVPGNPATLEVDSALAPLLAYAREEEVRFPLRLAQSLSRSLTAAGLRFHKSANRTTFVSASRSRHLDLAQVAVSDSIRKILETIREKKSLRRHQLLDLLAPLPAKPAVPSGESAPAGAAAAPIPEAAPGPEEAARAAVVQDLLWLTHEGYVVEYSDGRLESVPPPKTPPKAPEQASASPAPAQQVQPEA